MSKQTEGSKGKKQRRPKDRALATRATSKNKERRRAKHEKREKKKKARQEKRITSLMEKYKAAKGTDWVRREGRKLRDEIKYLEIALAKGD
jgi:hypothetical protein